jgi:hypothetical protein
MRRLLVNTFLSLFTGWLALLDHCLVAVAEMPISGEIVVLLLLQASIVALVMLLANGALSTVAAMATNGPSARMKFFVFGLPLILVLISPAMISDSIYRARYGNINKFVVHAHVGHDLACCFNPFSAKQKSMEDVSIDRPTR